jgi:hypothetical protein
LPAYGLTAPKTSMDITVSPIEQEWVEQHVNHKIMETAGCPVGRGCREVHAAHLIAN